MNQHQSHTFPPHPQFQPTPPPVPPKAKTRKGPLIITGIASLVLGFAVGSAGGTDEAAVADPQPTATVTVEAPEEKPAKEAKPAKEKPAKEEKPAAFGNGTYLVGEEMPAGRYKVTVPEDSWGCYWERTSDDSGEFESIIANEAGEAGANMSVTVKKGEFFNTSDCGEWVAA